MSLEDKLLNYYQMTKEELSIRSSFQPLEELGDPFNDFAYFKEGIDLIKSHVDRQDKIAIYGDYDVDGITSTSILVKAFKMIGVQVGFFIPSRFKEGYGLNASRVNEFSEKGYKLLITVDNGISAFNSVKQARNLGIDVLVVDHHTLQDELPYANCIIHPVYGKYCTYNISAAFLALLISYGLLGHYDKYLAALAGIAVTSDVMPLVEKNLILAKHALASINQRIYPQFNFLLSKSQKNSFTSRDISFSIVAPLNGLGKIDIGTRINSAVKFLISDDKGEVESLYKLIFDVNSQKKDKLKSLKGVMPMYPSDLKAEFIYVKGGEVGLIGALASSLEDQWKKPVFIYTESPESAENLVFSVRSPDSIDIYKVVEKSKDDFIAFGGHKCALGITLSKDKLEKLKSNVEESIKVESAEGEKAILLNQNDMHLDTLKTLNKFEPFGEGFKEPKFALLLKESDFIKSRDGNHLLNFSYPEASISYFSYPKELDASNGEFFYFTGYLDEDHFSRIAKLKFQISSYFKNNEIKIIK